MKQKCTNKGDQKPNLLEQSQLGTPLTLDQDWMVCWLYAIFMEKKVFAEMLPFSTLLIVGYRSTKNKKPLLNQPTPKED